MIEDQTTAQGGGGTASASRVPVIGVVSDTHGYYDPALDELLAGVSRIVHAGDVGALDILDRLQRIAPLSAVAGNIDLPVYEDRLPWEIITAVGDVRILVCHIGKSLMGRHDPVAEGFGLVVSGHTHKARIEWRGETLFLNPGAAGKGRFGLRRSIALVEIRDGRLEPRIVPLA
jgi:putative phosphoesterase